MGGDHHHHGAPYEVPDYRIYKVSDAPELAQVERKLAARGLKDPWLRNEVWRYNTKEFGTTAQRVRWCFFRGFGFGLGLFVVHMGGNMLYDRMYPSEDKHGHGHH